jgi:small subunit ribosomal protein S18
MATGPRQGARPAGGGGGGGRSFGFKRIRRKKCRMCTDDMVQIDYKNTDFLRNYITERGKMIPRRITGACAKHQRVITRAIKKGRESGFLPFIAE